MDNVAFHTVLNSSSSSNDWNVSGITTYHPCAYDNGDETCNNTANFTNARRSSNDPYIPLYLYIVVSIFNALIFIIGTLGNILVIVVLFRVREMRTPTNMFLLNLSIADLLVLLVCQPAGLLEFFGKDRWFLGEIMCKLVPLMENGMLHVSILTILAVTFERFNALCHPLQMFVLYTVKSSMNVILIIWVLGYLLTMPFLIMTSHEDAHFYDGTPIKVCRTRVDNIWRHSYIVAIFVMFFTLPFLGLIFVYSKIIRQLTSEALITLTRNDPSAMRTIRLRKQVVYMLICMIVLFFVSLFPIRVASLWLIFTPTEQVSKIGLEGYLNLMAWTRILMYVNSAGNPIIYSLTSTKFKMAFRKILGRYAICGVQPDYSSVRYSYRQQAGKFISTPLRPLCYSTLHHQKSTDNIKPSSSSKDSSRSSKEKRSNIEKFA